jgi:hypothetical protein
MRQAYLELAVLYLHSSSTLSTLHEASTTDSLDKADRTDKQLDKQQTFTKPDDTQEQPGKTG